MLAEWLNSPWLGLTGGAWYSLAVVLIVFIGLVREVAPADMVILGGAVLLALAGVVTPQEFFAGFSSPGLITVAALFVVGAGLWETGALDRFANWMLGKARTELGALLRMAAPLTGLSAFLNNTTVVAMGLPIIQSWCKKHRVSPSRLLMPLSLLSILGGTCTLIGTSTNLVVHAQLERLHATVTDPALREAVRPMGFFEISWVGLPSALLGVAYIATIGRRLLPDRRDLIQEFGEHSKDYLVNMLVRPECPLAGQRVDDAGLRRLPGLFLVEIAREDRIIAPVAPDQIIRAGDYLTFAGAVSTIVELERIRGLVPATPEAEQGLRLKAKERHYSEAVLSATSPLIGKSIRESNFRTVYNAAVVAVHRGGQRLEGRVGDIVLRPGDTLLLQGGPNFDAAHRHNPDFYLVSGVQEGRPVRHARANASLVLLLILIVLMSMSDSIGVHEAISAMAVGLVMIAIGCLSAGEARQGIAWDVLIAIAASFPLGTALEKTGAASAIAHALVAATQGFGPIGALSAMYLVTAIVTSLITNNAAAVLMFPFAIATAQDLGVDPRPFAFCVAFAASASFSTPIGYQTNLMVYGPGGYRFMDYVRVGLPLNVLLWVVATLLIPLIWPLRPLAVAVVP